MKQGVRMDAQEQNYSMDAGRALYARLEILKWILETSASQSSYL